MALVVSRVEFLIILYIDSKIQTRYILDVQGFFLLQIST